MVALIIPLKDAVVTSLFGPRIHPVTKQQDFHPGIDFAPNSPGELIFPAAPGKVLEVGYNSTRGNFIALIHADGTKTIYEHCSKILITKIGLAVVPSLAIAVTGTSGLSTGEHLHFELRDKNDKPIDPGKFLGLVTPAVGLKVGQPEINAIVASVGAVVLIGALMYFI